MLEAVDSWSRNQRQLIEESKHDAIRALSEGFAAKMERLQRQLTEKDVTVSNIARYFEEVVAELTEKSHRDPKTKLLNFDWFMERLESFLAVEQRVRWCGVGVVDINSFKWYNDTLGHARRRPDHRARGAHPLRSDPLGGLPRARARRRRGRDLHARFGGDEFCFLIPDLPGCAEAVGHRRALQGRGRGARLDAARTGGWPRARSGSTSASSACSSGRWPSGAASRASSRRN